MSNSSQKAGPKTQSTISKPTNEPVSLSWEKASRTGDDALRATAQLIKSGQAKNIIVLTGAGTSTSAGIPDFRSPETGLYANLQALNLPFPEAVFELGFFKQNPKPFWTLAKELYPGKHFPTPTHYFLTLLHRHQCLKRVFSQNIDTLETLGGIPADKIVEAHGSFATAHCLKCGKSASTEYVLQAGVRKGQIVRCGEKACGGLVKPDIVFFGEGLPDRFFEKMSDMSKCDLLIVIGTSLQVAPFSRLPDMVPSSCPRLLINREAVGPFELLSRTRAKGNPGSGGGSRKRDKYWEGDCDEAVKRLAEELEWSEELDKLMANGKTDLNRSWEQLEKTNSIGDSKAGVLDLKPSKAESAGVKAVSPTRNATEEAGAEAKSTPVQLDDDKEGLAARLSSVKL